MTEAIEQRLMHWGGSGPPLVFVHANGYPPGCYRQLLEPLAEVASVTAVQHRALWQRSPPARRVRWGCYVQDLLQAVDAMAAGPVWLVGHSMGASTAILAAAQHPEKFRGLILLDPVIQATRRVLMIWLSPVSRVYRHPMIQRTLKRPREFSSEQAVFDFHRPKRAYQGFSESALWDFVAGATVAGEGGSRTLAFSPEWEAAVYASTPWVWPALRRLSLPTLGIRGMQSDTLLPAMFERWRRVQPGATLETCAGGHLFPLEHPAATAARVCAFLQSET